MQCRWPPRNNSRRPSAAFAWLAWSGRSSNRTRENLYVSTRATKCPPEGPVKKMLTVPDNKLDVYRHGFKAYLTKSVRVLFFESWFNSLIICFPAALHVANNDGDPGTVFLLSLLAIAPFAERLSFVTEQLAMHTSEVFGGLLNATFGNVTELIVSLFALRYGTYFFSSPKFPPLRTFLHALGSCIHSRKITS